MPITQLFKLDAQNPDSQIIQTAAETLQNGGLVAFPTETVYGLGANAENSDAVTSIFTAKGRPANDPIIVHLHSLAQLENVAVDIPELARQLAAEFWPGPLTMVLKRHANIPTNVSSGMDTVAMRMPSHPVALALLRAADLPIAAPSANRFALPSATTAQHVLEDLDGRIDIILDGGSSNIGLESTVIDLTGASPIVLRPGGVSIERLREILPDIQLKSKYLSVEDAAGASPGMLLKHYSPKAKLLLYTGNLENVIACMQTAARDLITQGKRVGIVTPDSERAHFEQIGAHVILLGADLAQISYNLFNVMRELDTIGVDAILVRGFEQTGLGVALWDKLVRAAEGKIIQC